MRNLIREAMLLACYIPARRDGGAAADGVGQRVGRRPGLQGCLTEPAVTVRRPVRVEPPPGWSRRRDSSEPSREFLEFAHIVAAAPGPAAVLSALPALSDPRVQRGDRSRIEAPCRNRPA